MNPNLMYWKANSAEDIARFEAEAGELSEQEVDIDIKPVKVSELVRSESGGASMPVNIKPALLGGLDRIITEE